MRKIRIGFFLILLCIGMVCCANAETLQDVEQSRIIVADVPGIVKSVQTAPGKLDIVIDREKTDWSKAITYLYCPSYGAFDFPVQIATPANATSYRSYSGDRDLTDQELLDRVHIMSSSGWPIYAGSIPSIFKYEAEHSILRFQNRDFFQFVLCWLDSSENILLTEQLTVSVTFTSTEPIRDVSPKLAAYNDYFLGVNGALPQHISQFSGAKVEKDVLKYQLKDPDSVAIGVKGPNKAEYYQLYSPLPGFDSSLSKLDNGKAYVCTRFNGFFYSIEGDQAIIWLDKNKEPIGEVMISYCLNPIGKPWPSYTEDFLNLVPDERLTITMPEGDILSLEKEKETSLLHFTTTGKAPLSDDRFFNLNPTNPTNHVVFSICPPEGAVAYRSVMYGGIIMGDRFENAKGDVDEWMRRNSLQKILGNQTVNMSSFPIYNLVTIAEPDTHSKLDMYMPDFNGYTDESSGQIPIIYWYDSTDPMAKPMLREYIAFQVSFSSIEIQTAAVHKKEYIGHSEKPILLLPETEELDKKLNITIPPQSGERSQRYDLDVEKEDGEPVDLPEGSSIYLPYPPGCSMNGGFTYMVRHYKSGDITGGYEEIEPIKTPYGLLIQPSSLSPFILSWTASESASASSASPASLPPKTADGAMPLLWTALVLLSCTGIVFLTMNKRKRFSKR